MPTSSPVENSLASVLLPLPEMLDGLPKSLGQPIVLLHGLPGFNSQAGFSIMQTLQMLRLLSAGICLLQLATSVF